MDSTIYPQGVIDKFLNENMLFNDVKLKKYYDRNEPRDLKKFRDRLHSKYSTKTFEKMVYASGELTKAFVTKALSPFCMPLKTSISGLIL